VDDVGNLSESLDQSDRIYGKGMRLEKSKININERKKVLWWILEV